MGQQIVLGATAWSLGFGCISQRVGDAQLGNCPLGSAGCFCEADGGCEAGLVCLTDRCVRLNDGPDAGVQDESSGELDTTSATAGEDAPGSADNETNGVGPGGDASDNEGPDSGPSGGTEKLPGASCEDGQLNGEETDLDCGGGDCDPCAEGQVCRVGRDCASQRCAYGRCAAPGSPECQSDADCDDGQACTVDTCNQAKLCAFEPRTDGDVCDDQDPCTAQDQCRAGVCEGQNTRVIEEHFSGPHFAFLNEAKHREWGIGPAKESSCAQGDLGEDPGQDHTQDGANGVMGVVIGGCQTAAQPDTLDCAWSDYVDVSGFDRDVILSYWRHLSSPGFNPQDSRIPMVTNFIKYRVQDDEVGKLIEKGWPERVVDTQWTRIEHRVPVFGLGKVSFGICYKRLGTKGGFPGWTVDDVLVRQQGCMPDV